MIRKCGALSERPQNGKFKVKLLHREGNFSLFKLTCLSIYVNENKYCKSPNSSENIFKMQREISDSTNKIQNSTVLIMRLAIL